MSGSFGAQVVLDPASPAALGARGGAASTIHGNTVARDLGLISNGLDPLLTAGPPNAVVPFSLNFMRPGWLDPGVTFTRASTGTYVDASGMIQTAAINAPRWDYAGGVLRGLLIEEARTNIALQSGDLANAVWLKVGGPVAAPAATANQTTAPDGTLTAARIVYPAVSAAASYSVVYQNFASGSYTASIYLRGNAGGEQLYLGLTDNGANKARVRVTLTTSWQRFTLTASVAAAYGFTLGTDLNDVGQSATTGGTIFAWGAQTEAGLFATSYIPTTAATVTRAQDACTISPANMGWFASPGGSWLIELIQTNPGANNRIIAAGGGSSGKTTAFSGAGANAFGQYDGATPVSTANGMALGVVQKGVTTFSGSIGAACLNGGVVASVAMTTGYAALATNGVRFFADEFGTGATTGYIRRVQYWPRVLSDVEMQAMTA